MVTMRPTPAASARATMASRSSAKSLKSRWQWLSTSMLLLAARWLFRFDITREHADGCRQCRARRNAFPTAERRKIAFAGGNAEAVEQFCGGFRHDRQRQDRDLPHHFGGDVKHRLLPRRVGLGQRPWCL